MPDVKVSTGVQAEAGYSPGPAAPAPPSLDEQLAAALVAVTEATAMLTQVLGQLEALVEQKATQGR